MDQTTTLRVAVLAVVLMGFLVFANGGILIGTGLFFVAILLAVPLATSEEAAPPGSEQDSVSGPTGTGDRAVAVLRERYARGELTDEEFEARLDRLETTASDEAPETAEASRPDGAADGNGLEDP